MARSTGSLQLCGTFLGLWDDILPARGRDDVVVDLRLVAAELSATTG